VRLPAQARTLLRDAADVIEHECEASGEDEVRENPILRAHDRVARRIRRYLAKERAERNAP
jgi:hypothetical protein